jgi:putative ABC transport system permease protein
MYFRLLTEGFNFAFNSIIVNKLRTFLSLLGITIGIFCIISVFTVLDWMEKSIKETIASMGENVIFVQKIPWTYDPDQQWWEVMKWPVISKGDYKAVQRGSTGSESVCFIVKEQRQIKYKRTLASNVSLWAATHEFEKLRSFEIENGRYFSPEESASGKNVAILGSALSNKLFGIFEPLGKQIIIDGKKINIIGVFKKEGSNSLFESLDERIVIPLNFGKSFINIRSAFIDVSLMIKPRPGVTVRELSDETTMILRAARRLHPGERNNFSVNRTSMLTQSLESLFSLINIVGWIIGGFAVLVGGFGIANIMFVSVRERTNIIGIQKALGAKKSFILIQFLAESVFLSVIGGIIGVFLIFLATLVINYLYDLNIYLSAPNIGLAIFISGTIGMIAGYAPANSAAKMNPVEAIGFSF